MLGQLPGDLDASFLFPPRRLPINVDSLIELFTLILGHDVVGCLANRLGDRVTLLLEVDGVFRLVNCSASGLGTSLDPTGQGDTHKGKLQGKSLARGIHEQGEYYRIYPPYQFSRHVEGGIS